MKKTAKKLLALLLATTLCIGMTPAGTLKADSASEEIYTVTVDVTYQQTEARSMLEMINDLRTGDDAWAYNSKGEQVYYSNLSGLEYDYELEKIAMQRAVELVLNFNHTRPDGTVCTKAYTEAGYSWKMQGENIAVGYTSAEAAFTGWCETDEDYSGQGHRRNMLGSGYNRVGIACVKYNNICYWVQEFANSTEENTPTEANNSEATVEVNISSKMLKGSIAEFSPKSYTLIVGDTVDLPEMTSYKVNLTSTWPTGSYKTIGTSCTWSSEDESKVTVDTESGTLTAVQGGTVALDAATICGTYNVSITVFELEYVWDGTGCTAVLTNPDHDPSDSSSIGTVEIPCTVTGETTKASCGEEGSVTYTASFTYGDSGKTYTDTKTEAIPAMGHDWSEPEWNWAEDGSEATATFACENDATEVKSLTAGITAETLQELGCEVEGIVKHTATVTLDGETYIDTKTVTTSATGHSYDEGWVSLEPTCTEEGKMIYTCINCGKILAEAIPATGHSYEETGRVDPSCTEDGQITYTCKNCGDTYTETLDATGHTADAGTVTKEGTCTENGEILYTCTVCGATWTEVILATGHSYDEGWVSVEPTCTEEGKMIYTCVTCGEILQETIQATGHSYEEIGRVEATCTEDSQITYTCKNCGDTYTETQDATGHTAVHVNAKAATATENGNIEYWYCSECGKYFANETLTTEITEADTVIAATGNQSGSGANGNEGNTGGTGNNTSTGSSAYAGGNTSAGGNKSENNTNTEVTNSTGNNAETASGTDAKNTENSSGSGNVNTAAKTDDSARVFLWVFVLMAAAAGSCALVGYDRKKKFQIS